MTELDILQTKPHAQCSTKASGGRPAIRSVEDARAAGYSVELIDADGKPHGEWCRVDGCATDVDASRHTRGVRFLSVCSGIEAASCAWEPLGFEPVAFAEIDPFASAVLAHRYPNVPNLGDFTQIGAEHVGAVDLLVGGTPCQDFSVAGLRAGLAGERGKLTIEFVHLLERLQPRWFIWENVPGVLSADGRRAFGAFLGLLGQCGYGFAYRVLDAQYFGVPQRRRRVFVVGCLGEWQRAAAVLFEPESLRGDPAPRRKAGAIASALTANGVGAGGGPDDNAAQANHLIAGTLTAGPAAFKLRKPMSRTRCARKGMTQARTTSAATCRWSRRRCRLKKGGIEAAVDSTVIAFGAQVESPFLDDTALPVTARNGDPGMVAFALRGRDDGAQPEVCGDGDTSGGSSDMAVRRLTPVECERLQGFPDGWTAVPYRGKPAADGPRYRALGNSMAVPVMRWIGERLAMVERLD